MVKAAEVVGGVDDAEFHYPGQRLGGDPKAWLRGLFRHIIDEVAQYGDWNVAYLDQGPQNTRYVQGFSHKQLYLAAEPLANRRFESPQEALTWAWGYIGQRT